MPNGITQNLIKPRDVTNVVKLSCRCKILKKSPKTLKAKFRKYVPHFCILAQ